MASRVPGSTTDAPLVSDPILTTLYCAASCSCSVGACAAALDETIAIAIMAHTGVTFPRFRFGLDIFCHMTKKSPLKDFSLCSPDREDTVIRDPEHAFSLPCAARLLRATSAR